MIKVGRIRESFTLQIVTGSPTSLAPSYSYLEAFLLLFSMRVWKCEQDVSENENYFLMPSDINTRQYCGCRYNHWIF